MTSINDFNPGDRIITDGYSAVLGVDSKDFDGHTGTVIGPDDSNFDPDQKNYVQVRMDKVPLSPGEWMGIHFFLPREIRKVSV